MDVFRDIPNLKHRVLVASPHGGVVMVNLTMAASPEFAAVVSLFSAIDARAARLLAHQLFDCADKVDPPKLPENEPKEPPPGPRLVEPDYEDAMRGIPKKKPDQKPNGKPAEH